MSRLFLALFTLGLALTLAGPVAARCEIEHARYAQRRDPKVTAGFTAIPGEQRTLSPLALHIDFAEQKDRLWWFLDGGTARHVSLLSVTDPTQPGWDPEASQTHMGAMTIWFAGQDNELTYYYPKARQEAPAHLFIPKLEEVMWYASGPVERRRVAVGQFDLVGCA